MFFFIRVVFREGLHQIQFGKSTRRYEFNITVGALDNFAVRVPRNRILNVNSPLTILDCYRVTGDDLFMWFVHVRECIEGYVSFQRPGYFK
jgi:hypothetical protein